VAYKEKPLSSKGLKTTSLHSRLSHVHVADFAKVTRRDDRFSRFIKNLPDFLAAKDFRELTARMKTAKEKKKALIWAMGAHVIKVGLNPVLLDLMTGGWISALAFNGAGIIHDFELAYGGATSENVAAGIKAGTFGMARETGDLLNETIRRGAEEGLGLGEAVGRMIARSNFPYKKISLLGAAYRLNIPATVHVAVGTDIIHMHPRASGEALGKTSLQDFFLFSALVQKLEGGGVFLNIGSAVLLPEVFLKAVALVRNKGRRLDDYTTAVFDFIRHYRPAENVARRPLGKKGRGYYFVGHHEIMIPLLAAALKAL
jgi:hypothetical protein